MAFVVLSYVILCSFCVVCSQEFYTITRQSTTRRSDFDNFKVPASNCTLSGSHCKSYHEAAYATVENCKCSCPYGSSTFGYFKTSWTCLLNAELRRQAGCTKMFPSEQSNDPITVLKEDQHESWQYVVLDSGGCSIDYSRSRYLTCNVTWSQLDAANKPIYTITEKVKSKYHYLLFIGNAPTLRGQVISLYFKCPLPISSECLLFKLAGETKCVTANFKVITSTPTADFSSQPTTASNSSGPSKGTPRSSPSEGSSGVVAAVIVIAIIIIIIAALVGYIFWRRKRGERVWLLDQFSNLVRKCRQSSATSKSYKDAHEPEDEDIYEEIDEYPTITFVQGRTHAPPNGHARTHGGKPQEVSQRRGRLSVTDEAGYAVPVAEIPEYTSVQETNQHNNNPTGSPDGETQTSTRNRGSVADEAGYSVPESEIPEYSDIDDANTQNMNSFEEERNIEGQTPTEVAQTHQGGVETAFDSNTDPRYVTKKTRRRPPSPPTKPI